MGNANYFIFLNSVLLVWLVVHVIDHYRRKDYRELIAWARLTTHGKRKRIYVLVAYVYATATLGLIIPLAALVYLENNFFAAILSYVLPLQFGVVAEVLLLAMSKYRKSSIS